VDSGGHDGGLHVSLRRLVRCCAGATRAVLLPTGPQRKPERSGGVQLPGPTRAELLAHPLREPMPSPGRPEPFARTKSAPDGATARTRERICPFSGVLAGTSEGPGETASDTPPALRALRSTIPFAGPVANNPGRRSGTRPTRAGRARGLTLLRRTGSTAGPVLLIDHPPVRGNGWCASRSER
jgi:hypothetical protein